MLLLGNDDVRRLLTQAAAREIVREAATAYAAGAVEMPDRVTLHVERFGGECLFMPALIPGRPVVGIKVISVYGGNAARGLPNVVGALLLLDPETGVPSALIDAGYLTELRTAAMTAVAAEHLARPGSAVMTVVGTGGQARAHVHALVDAFPLTEVRVVSRSPERGRAFREALAREHPGVAFTAAAGERAVDEAMAGSDIVVAATASASPVLPPAPPAPGTLVCGIGSHTPDAAELPVEVVGAAARVVVDTRAAIEAGDIAGAIRAGALRRSDVAELGELVSGRRPGRQAGDEVTVFKSVGFAALDLVAGAALLAAAERAGAGRRVER